MESNEFVQKKLVNRTNAASIVTEAKNNRYHYILDFGQSIGWDWLYAQVQKANAEMNVDIELWEIHPSESPHFSVEVREVDRRAGIDDSQQGLTDFK